jgi:hypothetical protein
MSKTPRYRAYTRLIGVAQEIDQDLQLAYAAVDANGGVATHGDQLKIWELRSHLVNALKNIIPYEKPRLTAVKVSGDRKAPLFDLSGLSERELMLVRDIILKSQQVVSTDDDEGER